MRNLKEEVLNNGFPEDCERCMYYKYIPTKYAADPNDSYEGYDECYFGFDCPIYDAIMENPDIDEDAVSDIFFDMQDKEEW